MAKHECELFGTVTYAADISYHELYDQEHALIGQLQAALDAFGAEHLDFWGHGDHLRLQCALREQDQAQLEALCDDIAALLPKGATAKLASVDKTLCDIIVCWLEPGRRRTERLDLDR